MFIVSCCVWGCVCVCVYRERASAQPPPDPRLPPPSCLLLPPTPKRGGQKSLVSRRTNMHILVDAGLKVNTETFHQSGFNSTITCIITVTFLTCVYFSAPPLQSEKIQSDIIWFFSPGDAWSFHPTAAWLSQLHAREGLRILLTLSPSFANYLIRPKFWKRWRLFLPPPAKLVFPSNLSSPQVITEALMAFTLLLKFPLPAVEQNANQLTKQLFVLLKDYSKAGAARGENYHLVQNCFKVLQ